MLKEWIYSFKRISRVLIDVSLFALSLIISYKLRIEYHLPEGTQYWFWKTQLPAVIPFVISIRLFFLLIFQVYSRMWRYTELTEILELTKPILFSSVILSIPRLLGFSAYKEILVIPLGVIFIDSALSLIFLSSARLLRKWQISRRNFRKRLSSNQVKTRKRTILIGAGQAAQELVRKIYQHPELDIDIICALDDDERKQKIKIAEGVRVEGYIKNLSSVVKQYSIEQVIIAIPSLSSKEIRKIIDLCQATKLETKIIPGVDQLADGKVTIEKIRKISLEDLLGREPVDLSIPEIADFINNKTILITGAGGSIGSEITRQLVKNFTPKRIYILGRGENSIFQLTQELEKLTSIPFTPIICDIRNYNFLYKIMLKTSPDLVFHAAAHKHVPLMEAHPQEAFENNTIGTKNIAEISGLLNISTFVNISTDKAVNPINTLGFTKRLAELIVNSLSEKYPKTKYISVRFGNVIGSRGSVIPVWEWQLKNNLPITVTDKDAYRFFMTIPESAQLVIKAGAIGNTAEIMVLDMGSEVNIYGLAKDYIRLSGFDPEEVKINITGLRPGEKLKEELIGYYEGTNTTKHKKILVIKSDNTEVEKTTDSIKKLCGLVETASEEAFRNQLASEIQRLNQIGSLSKSPV